MSDFKNDKNILMVSRAVDPPWDEASRNLVRDIVSRVGGRNFHILTAGSAASGERNVSPLKIYSSRGYGLAQKMRLLWFLLVNRSRFALYHFCFTPEPLTSFLLKRIFKKRKKIQSIPYLSSKGAGKGYRNLIFSDAITVTSRYTMDILKKNGIEGVQVIYPGVDTERFTPDKDGMLARKIFLFSEKFNILWAGDLASEKVVRTLFCLIRETCLNEDGISFVIASRVREAGESDRRRRFQKDLKDAGLEDRVMFIDTVDDMALLMAACDLFIYPLFEGFRKKVDIPYVIVEAMASGIPVIISDKEPINEVIRDGAGLAVGGEDLGMFAEKIGLLYKDKDLRLELAKKNREVALRYFDVNANMEKFAKIYESLLT